MTDPDATIRAAAASPMINSPDGAVAAPGNHALMPVGVGPDGSILFRDPNAGPPPVPDPNQDYARALVDARRHLRQLRDEGGDVEFGPVAQVDELNRWARAITAALAQLPWRHALGASVDCEGCHNDGHFTCVLPVAGDERDPDSGDPYCDNCGHLVEVGLDPSVWRCAGEDSEHWPKHEVEGTPLAECGHCGWQPDADLISEYIRDGSVTEEQALEWVGVRDGRSWAEYVGGPS